MVQEPLDVTHANRLDRDRLYEPQESPDPATVRLFGFGGVGARPEHATKAI